MTRADKVKGESPVVHNKPLSTAGGFTLTGDIPKNPWVLVAREINRITRGLELSDPSP